MLETILSCIQQPLFELLADLTATIDTVLDQNAKSEWLFLTSAIDGDEERETHQDGSNRRCLRPTLKTSRP